MQQLLIGCFPRLGTSAAAFGAEDEWGKGASLSLLSINIDHSPEACASGLRQDCEQLRE